MVRLWKYFNINRIIHLQFLELCIIILGTWSWSANSIEPVQTAHTCRRTYVQTGLVIYWGQWLIIFGSCRIRIKYWKEECFLNMSCHLKLHITDKTVIRSNLYIGFGGHLYSSGSRSLKLEQKLWLILLLYRCQ